MKHNETLGCPTWMVYQNERKQPRFDKYKGLYTVIGCCGNCNVVEDMRFCPFCREELNNEETSDKDNS